MTHVQIQRRVLEYAGFAFNHKLLADFYPVGGIDSVSSCGQVFCCDRGARFEKQSNVSGSKSHQPFQMILHWFSTFTEALYFQGTTIGRK